MDLSQLISNKKKIENLLTYNKLFFDLHSKEPIVTIEKLTANFDKDFQIKKVFVLNALLLPYLNFLTSFSNFGSDEIILTNLDYALSISKSEKEKIDEIIKKLSKSVPVWISEGPLVPEDFYKFDN